LAADPPIRALPIFNARRLTDAVRTGGPPLLFGLRLWASACLALYVAFWLELDNAQWAGTTAAIVCQPHLGASLRKGWFRMIGTVVGAVAIVVLTACFPQDRAAFLVSLALWGAGCALVSTLLRNFAAYSAALAGYTVAIIASDQLGAVGGLNGQAFTLAVTRASEICIGIVCAGVVLAGTDFGGARRRLATLFAAISAEITGRFNGNLSPAGLEFLAKHGPRSAQQAVRHGFAGRFWLHHRRIASVWNPRACHAGWGYDGGRWAASSLLHPLRMEFGPDCRRSGCLFRRKDSAARSC